MTWTDALPRTTVDAPAPRVPRAASALLAAAAITVGPAGRALLPPPVGDPLADALAAVTVVGLLALAFPRTPLAVAASVAFAACAAVETLHLTPVADALLDRFLLARLVLGTPFGVVDLAWNAIGACLGAAVLAAVTHRSAQPSGSASARRGRRVASVVAPLTVLALLTAGGVLLVGVVDDEADELSAQVATAQRELDTSADKVTDDAVRERLGKALGQGESVLEATPVLQRLPGDAPAAVTDLEQAVAVVRESRREYATDQATAAREELAPARRRAETVLDAADELAASGQDAGEASRAAVRDALGAADDTVTLADPDRLAAMPLSDLEQVAPALMARHDAVGEATADLMSAQDAVVCPFPDQVWFPEGGRIAADRLAPIPWAPEHSIRADLLDGLVALDEAYLAAFGEHLTVNSAYRSMEDQTAVYTPANPNPLAAPPGCSNHGLGTAVDLSVGPEGFDGARFAWLTEHAEEYGWTHPDWAGPTGRLPEPWHWESVETPDAY
ncbi:DUF2809 domain-containing protein [Isoptericola sediminis]|uniref:DUF2809 domain-containing protein n=1 Tax=Isoptericola sediminis TaxID=2733572 RepID=A0A849JSU6_9MICO|nr:DUF2809 domain-containing protein [Isoptericola sediminis]